MRRVSDGRIVNHAASRAKVICEVVTQLERLMRRRKDLPAEAGGKASDLV